MLNNTGKFLTLVAYCNGRSQLTKKYSLVSGSYVLLQKKVFKLHIATLYPDRCYLAYPKASCKTIPSASKMFPCKIVTVLWGSFGSFWSTVKFFEKISIIRQNK